jgi:hypothetical protein
MKLIKVISLATLALGIASAASSYSVKFTDSVWIGGTQLKPGDYKVEMQGDKAVFKSGKNVAVEVPATLEQSDKRYDYTSFLSQDSKVSEIDVGRTNMKILLAPAVSASK